MQTVTYESDQLSTRHPPPAIRHPRGLRALLVAEGSGGHMIPALQAAMALGRGGISTTVWYARRPQIASLAEALAVDSGAHGVTVEPVALPLGAGLAQRAWSCGQLWRRTRACLDTFAPDVVVGFGGWVSVPVVLAAKTRGIPCLLHEQNAVMGRANRWLSAWADVVAVSFPETAGIARRTSVVMTGLPIREAIGRSSGEAWARRVGLGPRRPTLLILGGSQGAGAINRLMGEGVTLWSAMERQTWQVVHVAGGADAVWVRQAYASAAVTAWVAPFLTDMGDAYALADVVIARAGASTIAELARSGKPAILIPYPHARGHQRANARLVEAVGGGVIIEESRATPSRLLEAIRQLCADQRLRETMGARIRALDSQDASARLAEAIRVLALRRHHHGSPTR